MTACVHKECGVRAIISNPAQFRIFNKYKQETGGKMQFISDCGVGNNFVEGIEASLEGGANALYSHGGKSDYRVYNNDLSFFEELANVLQLIGADFICFGMYDFQIVEDVNII